MRADDPCAFRQYVIAIRAHNRINRGEDPAAVRAQVMPMLDSGDGLLS